jgi:NADPH-dependent 2,4-dienoyl-CoA reductase/sulfur reductase-like enzyme
MTPPKARIFKEWLDKVGVEYVPNNRVVRVDPEKREVETDKGERTKTGSGGGGRRDFLKTVGGVVAGLIIGAAVGATAFPRTETVTTTTTVRETVTHTVTQTVAQPAAPPSEWWGRPA